MLPPSLTLELLGLEKDEASIIMTPTQSRTKKEKCEVFLTEKKQKQKLLCPTTKFMSLEVILSL